MDRVAVALTAAQTLSARFDLTAAALDEADPDPVEVERMGDGDPGGTCTDDADICLDRIPVHESPRTRCAVRYLGVAFIDRPPILMARGVPGKAELRMRRENLCLRGGRF
jgi:hypothetical protein